MLIWFFFKGQPSTTAANDQHDLPDRNLPVLPCCHAPLHSPTYASKLHCPLVPPREVPDIPSALCQRCCCASCPGQDATSEREPPPVTRVQLRGQAARGPAAVRERRRRTGPAPPAELHQGRESAGNHESERSAVAPAAAAIPATAPAQTHHEQTGNVCIRTHLVLARLGLVVLS